MTGIGDATGDSVMLYLELPECGEGEWPWDTEVPDYQVEYTTGDGNWYNAMVFTEDDTAYTLITGLEPETTYHVQLRIAAQTGEPESPTSLQTGRWPGPVTTVDVTTGKGCRLPYYFTYNGFRVDELTQYFLLTEGETLTVEPDWETLEQNYEIGRAHV